MNNVSCRPFAASTDDDDSEEECLDSIPLMCGDSFEMDESDRLVKERRRRRSRINSIGYFLSEGWFNLCARSETASGLLLLCLCHVHGSYCFPMELELSVQLQEQVRMHVYQ